jgi:hypothetical protein
MADQLELPKKASFFSSVMSGIGGYFKGMLAGGVVGAVGGALVGAVIAGITLATGGVATAGIAAALIGGQALTGALIGGSALASIGAIAGAITGVVKSREANQPTAEDVVNVAKISFAQGVAVGHNLEHAQHHQQGKGQHADRYLKEKAAVAMAERQVIQ